jgi:hypothetical protein
MRCTEALVVLLFCLEVAKEGTQPFEICEQKGGQNGSVGKFLLVIDGSPDST